MSNINIAIIILTLLVISITIILFLLKRKSNVVEKVENETLSEEQLNKSDKFVQLLGGKNNIKEIIYCKTRLKIEVLDNSIVEYDNEVYVNNGAAGIIKKPNNKIDIIVGFDVEKIYNEIKKVK